MVCNYYSSRADALTKKDFERFLADNPAYQEGKYLLIENNNPSPETSSKADSPKEARPGQEA